MFFFTGRLYQNMNSEDENFEFHAMVMVGMGYTDDEESGKSLDSTKRWKPKASRCGRQWRA